MKKITAAQLATYTTLVLSTWGHAAQAQNTYTAVAPSSVSTTPVAVSAPASTPASVATPAAGCCNIPLPFRLYGFLKPTFTIADGVETFNQANLSAPTAAVNPVFSEDPNAAAFTLQANQSRFGVVLGEGTPVKAVAELDFIHFDQASPTTAGFPRVRQAYVEYTPVEGQKIAMGQMWDLFAPVNPHTFNYIASGLTAGNSGFMRQQAMWQGTFGVLEVGGAVGLPAANNASSAGNVEYGLIPTAATKVAIRLDKNIVFGVTGIGSQIRLAPETFTYAYAGNVYADVTLGIFNLRAEAYAGQNTANLGLLTLAVGRADADLQDAGGFVSAKATLFEQHSVYGTLSGATVLDIDKVKPGYTPATDTAAATRTALGIGYNAQARLGYSFSPIKGLSFVVEPFLLATEHELHPQDAALFSEQRIAFGADVGALYQF